MEGILFGFASGIMVELVKYLAKLYLRKRKTDKPRPKQIVFNLSSSKKELTRFFYLGFTVGLILLLFALLINFNAVDVTKIKSEFGIGKFELLFVFCTFSSMSFINHFISFHESLAHWDENIEDVATSTKTNDKK